MKLPWAYFDTSVYLKLYVREKGSEETRKLAKKKRILSSAILPTECFSALSRKKDEGYLTNEDFGKLANHIKEDLLYIEIIRLTDDALEKAEDVALNSTARALDALHIASALIFQEATNIELTFITSDKKQQKIANHYGLMTLFVE